MRNATSVFTAVLLVGCLHSSVLAAPAPCSGGVVALTFDDGPTPETNAILDELKLYHLKATFFLIGLNVQAYPEIAQRIIREGHNVGNHTWDHQDLTLLTDDEINQELKSTNDIIRQVTGVRPKFVRPPYGSTNAAVRAVMAKYFLTEVIWSQDSWDWAGATTPAILNQLTLVPSGGTLMMHDHLPNTLAAISGIDWYFNTYWKERPICAGKLEPTTTVQPVMNWMGLFFFARAVQWPVP